MLEQCQFQFCPEPRSAPGTAPRGITAPDSPRKNRLLAALPPEDYARLLPHLTHVPLPLGWTVHQAGDRESFLYFPIAGIVSRSYVSADGVSSELAITGNEGAIGVASFLGGMSSLIRAEVVCAGSAYRLRVAAVKGEFARGGPMANLLLRYTEALIVQTAQLAVCNRHHSMKQQLCRWILSCLDRLPSDELDMTHELTARIMGVRRESISEAAGKLRSAGLIDYRRGHIAVPDPAALEAQACECHGVVKREYARLFHPTRGPWPAERACSLISAAS